MKLREAFVKPVLSPLSFAVIAGVYLFISLLEYVLFGSTDAWKTVLDMTLFALVGTYINLRSKK